VAEREQVLGQRAPAPQVEAPRRRGERRDHEHRELAPGYVGVRVQVAQQRPLRALLDHLRRGRAQVGEPDAEERVEDVRRRRGGVR
jgi:hypothetical protein